MNKVGPKLTSLMFRRIASVHQVEIGVERARKMATSTSLHPTIFALSTSFQRSAIGVIRISGTQSGMVYNRLTRTEGTPVARKASVRKLFCPETGTLLDEAVTLFFKSPHSYTGEDLLELHVHGGTAVIQAVIEAIKRLHNPGENVVIRYAEGGDFSKRAFVNGRFDLTELEGIREMIDSETESQRIASLASMKGDTRNLFLEWRQEIVQNVALLTTIIDFGEDHDIEEVAQLFDTVQHNICRLSQQILAYLDRLKSSKILLDGIRLTILGPPNAGKSSLLNYLANKDSVIVSDIAGTTRDAIDIPLDINGFKVIIGDTAGIRSASAADSIELEGMKRAILKSLTGELALVVLPLAPAQEEDDLQDLVDHVALLKKKNKRILVILNKADLLQDDAMISTASNRHARRLGLDKECFHIVSCKTGLGISDLQESLTGLFKLMSQTISQDPILISERAQDLLRNDVLRGFEGFLYHKEQDDVVLALESLKDSVEGIGKITGEAIGVEEILGVVFSKFCIGK